MVQQSNLAAKRLGDIRAKCVLIWPRWRLNEFTVEIAPTTVWINVRRNNTVETLLSVTFPGLRNSDEALQMMELTLEGVVMSRRL
jgi:hypothetical protein